ncbi:SDR family NAD(P)-dependent oxidoreductase [Corynebacterium glyciniphilum]|uniref:SDR family NAD(P)-dependent oxidoreductase n=1 Tax=Corynebacterium glyciniphilum TaxID=1404244 RepID=UPI003FD3A658
MNNIDQKSENPVVYITGAGSGIGKWTAQKFYKEGYKLALVGNQKEPLEHTFRDLNLSDEEAAIFVADVSVSAEVEASVSGTIKKFGRLDVAHNNAGITSSGPNTHELTQEAWDRTIAVDLTGVWLGMKYQIPIMLEQGHGSIVNTCSIAGHVGYPGAAAYSAAKHGVVGLTKTAAVEYAATGVRINAVSPGPVESPMMRDSLARRGEKVSAWYEHMSPAKRFAELDEIADAVYWLGSGKSTFVNGHCLSVDGGWVAQ